MPQFSQIIPPVPQLHSSINDMKKLDNRLDALPKDVLNLVHDTLAGTKAYWREQSALAVAPLAAQTHN